jgi:hypothetical protein
MATGDTTGAQAVIRAAQLQHEKAADLYQPLVKPARANVNPMAASSSSGGGGSFTNPLLERETLNPLLEKKNSQGVSLVLSFSRDFFFFLIVCLVVCFFVCSFFV